MRGLDTEGIKEEGCINAAIGDLLHNEYVLA